MRRYISYYTSLLLLLLIATKISAPLFPPINLKDKNQSSIVSASRKSKLASKSLPLLSDIKNKEKKFEQFSVEEHLLLILEQNLKFVRGSAISDDGKLINTFDEFVQAQENRIYFVEDILHVDLVNMTEAPHRFPLKYYSNPSFGITNLSSEYSVRCKYGTNQLFYTPMKDWRYPVYKMTKMKNTQEFRLQGTGDDITSDKKSIEKVTKTFERYEKLTALYFNCPTLHDCDQLTCKNRGDEEIIAIKLSELGVAINATNRLLPSAATITYKNYSFSVSQTSKELPAEVETLSYQCAFNLSQTVKSKWLGNIFVEINGSISSLDIIYETLAVNSSCLANPNLCCGLLCCVTITQPPTPQNSVEVVPSFAALWGIGAFIGAAAAIGVVLCIANYLSLQHNKKHETLDDDEAFHPSMKELDKMIADGKLKKIRRGPRLRS